MSRKHFPPSRSIRAAFTIVELLVAVAVTAVLVTFMVTVTSNVLSAWNRSSGVLSAGNQARTIMDQISQDLEGAIIRRGSDVMFAATIQADAPSGLGSWSGVTKPQADSLAVLPPAPGVERALVEHRFGQAGVWLRFFTTPSDNTPDPVSGQVPLSNISAPRAVAYQMQRVDMGGGQYSYLLYRSEVDPEQVFSLGYDLATSYTGGVIRNPSRQWIIGNDVIDFGIRLYERTASGGLTQIFPVKDEAIVGDFAASTTNGYPAVAEVFLRILSPEGVRQLAALEAGSITGDWWTIAEQNSQVYTRRIEIKSKGL